jgi:hypothetical protein
MINDPYKIKRSLRKVNRSAVRSGQWKMSHPQHRMWKTFEPPGSESQVLTAIIFSWKLMGIIDLILQIMLEVFCAKLGVATSPAPKLDQKTMIK